MLKLQPAGPAPLERVLCLGAHCDDIEIGCGGALMRLARERKLEVVWIIFASDEARAAEAKASAALFLEEADCKRVLIHSFRDGFLPLAWGEIKEACERVKREFSPDLVFTHFRHDLHQDHRLVSELTWNTFRDHLILEYEIPKYDGDMGAPNFFVHLDDGLAGKKASLIRSGYPSQAGKAWFSEDTFLSLMRLRGMESQSPGRYAEGFYCRKLAM